MDYQQWDFWSAASPTLSKRGWFIRPWNLFMRDYGTGKFAAGLGLIQIASPWSESRHLFYVGRDIDIADEYDAGHDRWFLCVAFVWLIGRAR